MGKFNFGVSSSAATEKLTGVIYDGPVPPVANYWFKMAALKLTKNRNDDYMLKARFVIAEPDGSEAAQYNGFACFEQYNVTDQGAPWLNNMLEAIGADPEDFWDEKLTTDSEKPPNILKIGRIKPVGQLVRGVTKADSYTKEGQTTATETRHISQFITPTPDYEGTEPNEDVADEEAVGLDEDVAGSTESDEDLYTEEELNGLGLPDLKGILDEWEVAYAAKATKKTLVSLILETQAGGDEEEAAEDDAEEAEEDVDEADEAEDTDDSEDTEDGEESDGAEVLTDDDLNEMSDDDLKEWITENGWKMPKPSIRRKLIAAIKENQDTPPF